MVCPTRGRREKTILATKFYGDMSHKDDGPNSEGGLSAYKLRRHLEGSLRRLQTDHIELYQMHHVDRNVSWNELWGGFETAVLQGKIGCGRKQLCRVGSCGCTGRS